MITIEDKSSLSVEETEEVLQFADTLYKEFTKGYSYNGSIIPLGFPTPFSQSQNLVNLTNYDGKMPTYQSLTEAISNYKQDPHTLQGYSEFMEIYDTIINKTINYYNGLLAYDLSITCKNVKDPEIEYSSKEYKDDLKRVYKFLDSFDYKQEFSKVTKQILRSGVSFNWLRDSQGTYNEDTDALEIEKQRNFALQFLPQKECMITGSFNKGSILFDFNMQYFMNSTVDIGLFDPWFRVQYKKIYTDNKEQNYIPSSQLNVHNGVFSNYTQTSPIDGAWCFKWDETNFATIPPFISLVKSAIDNDEIAKLQKNKNFISAYLLLAGEIGIMDNLKSGDKPNQTKFTPQALGQFMSLVTSGLKENVKACAFPLENIKGWQYNDSNPNMLNGHYKTISAQGASASPLIYTDGTLSQFAMQSAIIADYNIVKKLYTQYSNFLEFYINRKTRKYKFNFTLNGCTHPFEREIRQNAISELSDKGLTLNTSAWASAYGFKPQEFERMLEEACYGDMTNKLTMLMNRNTMKNDGSNQSVGGRPESDDTEISDSGALSKDYK